MAEKKLPIGNMYEDFTVGQVFKHHWGRTLTETDNILFTSLTLTHNPMYFNKQYARRFGHSDVVINPVLAFHMVLGLTVEDLSEAGEGPFLGVDNLMFRRPIYPGDTLYAESIVIDRRESRSRPDFGIVTWKTVAKNQDGHILLEYERRNLVRKGRGLQT